MNKQFVDKMIQAKILEHEALLSILPTSQQEHIKVIEKELMAIVKECALKGATFTAETMFTAQTAPKENKNSKKTMKKVNIE